MKITGKIFLGVIVVCATHFAANSQGFVDNAFLFGQTKSTGSARIQSIGGASVALGGDYTVSFSNPAGLGMYNRSEATLTTALSDFSVNADYLGDHSTNGQSVFNIPGISVVFHEPMSKGGLIGSTFAISMTRTNNYRFPGLYSGTATNSSLLDYFIDNANGYTPGNLGENSLAGLAYDTYVISPISEIDSGYPDGNKTYFSYESSFPDQMEEIKTKGANNQWNFAYGGNYKDRLFFGAALGISTLSYNAKKDFSEFFSNDTLNYMKLHEEFDITGSGINATFGVIGRPVDFLQLGISLTTPTYYYLRDEYYASLEADWNNFDYNGDGSIMLNDEFSDTDPNGLISEYGLLIPLKLRTGVTFLSKFGFVTAEMEVTNPARTKYSSETGGVSFSPENAEIRNTYKRYSTYKIGAEGRYKIFRFRAGYAHAGNPTYDNDLSSSTISGGTGVRIKNFFADFTVSSSKSKNNYSPYTVSYIDPEYVSFRNKNVNYILTAGFTF